MPKGPQGQWRPADPMALAAHVMKIATGELPESTEPPPPEDAQGDTPHKVTNTKTQ